MSENARFPIQPAYLLAIRQLGLNPGDVLRRAELPEDLLARKSGEVTGAELFRLWEGLERSAGLPTMSLTLGQQVEIERFDPLIFVVMCSPDLRRAAERGSAFKRLIAPVRLDVLSTEASLILTFTSLDPAVPAPASFLTAELVFWVALARQGTREQLIPRQVELLEPTTPAHAAYFGLTPTRGGAARVHFARADAERPFLTANERIWEFFEPSLRTRLQDLDAEAGAADRIRAALTELLPTGQSGLDDVSKKLGVGRRTLQRRLAQERTTYQAVLDETRRTLAMRYLESSRMAGAEIAFLLGFEDPSSFSRAFSSWTGHTPEEMRARLRVA